MWRRLRGLSVDAFSEMPHAEKNFSHHVHDSSVEPCLKKSRADYSSSWARGDTASYKEHEVKSQTWSFSTFSEERCHPSGRGGGGVDAQYNSELLKYRSGQGDANERDRNKTRQRPLVLPAREKPEYNPDKTFSATSTSFIGPLYRPSRQKKSLLGVTSNRNAALSYQIATVELGKLASQSKGQDGMDYELRQFYKELNALQAEADDQTKQVTYTDVDIKQGIGVYPDKTPTTHPTSYQHGQVPASQPLGPFPSTTNYQHGQVPASQPLGPFPSTTNYQHGQVPASQSLGPFPSTPSNLASLPCHAKEDARPPLPLNNQFSCDGHAPYHPTNSSFVSHAIPPPRFEGHHPPTFIVPYGPPPPRFNYPMTFPRQSNALPPPPSQNFNYNTRHGHPPWHGSPAPPDSRFTSPGSKPFLQSTGERTWPELQHDDLCRPEDGQFGDRILPHTGNVSHEQYRYGDKGKMVLLRGVPGSGKSTLARTLLQQSPDGIVLSTDDYFCEENGYTYDVKLLGDAHNWNQNRARRALDDGRSPVIIDNTNIQGWEMKPYVQMAVDRGYNIEFLEPDTWWKQDTHELEKRNTHRVPREKISQMLERYEYDLTVPVVMSSVEPRRTRPNRPPPEARPRWGASVDCSHNSLSFHSR